jgi:chromosome partition protein MukE
LSGQEREDIRVQDEDFPVLWKRPDAARKVIHALLGGRHIDPYLAEEFRFLENHPQAWEQFFQWMGYRLKRSELGGSPFFYLDPVTELAAQSRLSRGATFLGLYLAWHFFMQGPGESDGVSATDIFRKLVSSYKFHFLRSVFVRKTGHLSQMELSEDQAEKLRGYMRRELQELARYRFLDLRPSPRADWEDLTLHRLPALYRFWEVALHARGGGGADQDLDIDEVVAQVWGNVDADAEEDEA